MDIYTLGIIVSILIYVVVGNYAGRKVKGLEDYFVAGRAAPTVLIVGTLVASLMSTNTFLGDAAMSYEGYAGMWILAPATHLMLQTDLNAIPE